jgi:hypothetical protein
VKRERQPGEGDLGLGRGGAAVPQPREEPIDVRFNREVREALAVVTGRLPLSALTESPRRSKP